MGGSGDQIIDQHRQPLRRSRTHHPSRHAVRKYVGDQVEQRAQCRLQVDRPGIGQPQMIAAHRRAAPVAAFVF